MFIFCWKHKHDKEHAAMMLSLQREIMVGDALWIQLLTVLHENVGSHYKLLMVRFTAPITGRYVFRIYADGVTKPYQPAFMAKSAI